MPRPDGDPAAWTRWCARTCPAPTPAEHAPFVDQSAALHAALLILQDANAAGPAAPAALHAALRSLEALVSASAIRLSFDAAGARVLRPRDARNVAGRLLAIVLDAMRRNEWRRFKLCRDPPCRAQSSTGPKPA